MPFNRACQFHWAKSLAHYIIPHRGITPVNFTVSPWIDTRKKGMSMTSDFKQHQSVIMGWGCIQMINDWAYGKNHPNHRLLALQTPQRAPFPVGCPAVATPGTPGWHCIPKNMSPQAGYQIQPLPCIPAAQDLEMCLDNLPRIIRQSQGINGWKLHVLRKGNPGSNQFLHALDPGMFGNLQRDSKGWLSLEVRQWKQEGIEEYPARDHRRIFK